jgi:hypothetical protein
LIYKGADLATVRLGKPKPDLKAGSIRILEEPEFFIYHQNGDDAFMAYSPRMRKLFLTILVS